MRRYLAIVTVMLITMPAAVEAQFTTVVAPPREKVVAQSAEDAAAARARADSIMAQRLTDMREWVDSAAVAISGVPDTLQVSQIDSGDVIRDTAVVPAAPPRRPTTEFREGAPAPATATSLPMLALVGIGALGIGAVLLGRPRG